jgi:hypothetical protein
MAQIAFSWQTKKGLGILILIGGWALIFQVIPIYHALNFLNIGQNATDWLPLSGTVLLFVILLTALISTILENWGEQSKLYQEGLTQVHILIVPVLVVYTVGYLIAIPVFDILAPFVQQDILRNLTGWVGFLASLIIGTLLIIALWLFSEAFPKKEK